MSGANDQGSPLVIRLLGPWDVQLQGRPLPPLRSRKGQWLLALLVLHRGRAVARDWLAGTLWPDSPNTQAMYNLRRNLSDLRRALGAEGFRLRTLSPHALSLDLEGAQVDVAQFDDLTTLDDRPSLATAVRLYRGPLLPDCLEEWVVPERTEREQAYLGALESLAREATQRRDHEAAARYLHSAVAVDPLRESAQAALMEALAARGDSPAAARVYHEFSRLLHREMNAAPAAETTALFRRIRAQARAAVETAKPSGTAAGGREGDAGDAGSAPPRGRAAPLSNLPQPVSSFVGRDCELSEIVSALAAARLVTLTGAGGVGKTRLAIRAGEQVLLDYPDGVWFVDLAALASGGDLALVAQTAAGVLGASEQPGRPVAVTLRELLQARRLLLILDNCEHLLEACAELAACLLVDCPHLRVLATSRQPLGVTGEIAWQVPPLSVPGVQAFRRSGVQEAQSETPERPYARTPECLMQFEAVRLFVERGRAAARWFELTVSNAPAVAAICRHLDGLPLALELAAARLKALTVEQIAARLDDRFRLLTGGSRAALPRQQTLRATIDWSYELLAEPERALFRCLSVFAGGFTLEAAEAVCRDFGFWILDFGLGRQSQSHPAGEPFEPSAIQNPKSKIQNPEVLDLLTALVDKSLVLAGASSGRPGRVSGPGGHGDRSAATPWAENQSHYRLLETLREYAAERLSEEEWNTLSQRHAQYFLALAEAALPRLSETEWLDRLEREHDNLRAAVDWALREEEGEVALRLGAALGAFWNSRGYWREGRERLAAILALEADGGDPVALPDLSVKRAHALDRAGELALLQNDELAARELHEQALAIYRQLGDRPGAAFACAQLANIARRREEYATARALLAESLTFYQDQNDRDGIGMALLQLGQVAEDEGDHSSAQAFYRQGLASRREQERSDAGGDSTGVMFALQALGRLAYLDGDPPAARALFAESLTIARELGNQQGLTFGLYVFGSLARLEQDYESAAAYHSEGLALYRELGDEASVAGSLAALAFIAHFQGERGQAAALFQEALRLNRKLGSRRRTALCLEGLAGVALGVGCWVLGVGSEPSPPTPNTQHPTPSLITAARLFGAAAALREGDSPRWPADQADYERNLVALRTFLDEAQLAAAWDEGAALPFDQAIVLALSIG